MSLLNRWKRPLILAYHSVCDEREDGLAVRTADFRRQMHYLAERGYRSVRLSDLSDARIEKAVAITFDDGYSDNFTHAMPILQELGFVATVFVVADMIDSPEPFWWDAPKIRTDAARQLFQPLSWERVRLMADAGFEIGSHTCTHPDGFAELSPEARWKELAQSKDTIERHLGETVRSFSYPRGSVDRETIRLVERAGYEYGVVTPPRSGIPRTKYTLRRAGIYRNNGDLVFRLKTSATVGFVSEQVKRFKKPIQAIPPELVRAGAE
jgi:peptidoglycan/xylan/chitin deacetylase (PgdA/CDA1 family)